MVTPTMYLIKSFLLAFYTCLLVNGCAFDVYQVALTPVQIDTLVEFKAAFELRKDVKLDIGFGYERHLLKGTVWNHLGTIDYGDVYSSKDQLLTIEASNIYEACLVIFNGRLVGFYLPVEDSYSPLSDPVQLPMQVSGTDLEQP